MRFEPRYLVFYDGAGLNADFHTALTSDQLARYDEFDESRADFSRWNGLYETWLRRKAALA